ncbi:MAG: IS1595 family transposase [Bryobacteraceae bacterium]
MEANVPQTLLEAVQFFNNFENCKAFMVALRWPDGKVLCPRCGSDDVEYLPNAKVFKCYKKHPQQKFSLKVGTIFEDSPIALEKWLPVMWLIVNAKNGISSWEIHRSIGVTQKTAWFMLQRARLAMQNKDASKLSGEIEVDETYIGGAARNMHKDRKRRLLQGKGGGVSGKTGVQGVLERGGQVRTEIMDVPKHGWDLKNNVRKHAEVGSHIFSDEAKAYFGLQAEYVHEFINHAETYVNGNVHTNGLENFWSLLKRGLGGTYVSVEPFHLFRYVDEQAFRYNHRKDMNDADRFVAIMGQIVGKRLTYAEVTGKVGERPLSN